MPPKKDSLQLFIDNFEKNTANYDKINQLLDVKSKDDNVHEKNLLALKSIRIEICKKITNSKLIKQFDNLVDSLVKEKEKINKKDHQITDSLKKEELKENNLIVSSCSQIQSLLSKKQGSISFTFKGSEFYFFIADLNKHELRLHVKKDSLKHYPNTIGRVVKDLKDKKLKPLAVTNAGMFETNYKPLGLYIENSKELVALNCKDPNDDNFYLMPNGVFFY